MTLMALKKFRSQTVGNKTWCDTDNVIPSQRNVIRIEHTANAAVLAIFWLFWRLEKGKMRRILSWKVQNIYNWICETVFWLCTNTATCTLIVTTQKGPKISPSSEKKNIREKSAKRKLRECRRKKKLLTSLLILTLFS